MEIKFRILPETNSVFLLSGSFLEGDTFSIGSDEVVYLTVLPLGAAFLPYTVKLIGCVVASNKDLALCVRTGEREYALKLGRRNFVYSEGHFVGSDDPCCEFFYFVKGGHFNFASELLSPSLKSGLSDKAMQRFFFGYSDIVKVDDKFFLVDGDGVGKPCSFSLANGKIDNIYIDE